MIALRGIVAAAVVTTVVSIAGPRADAAEGGAQVEPQSWSFAGIFGRYDRGALQRGFQV
ncbi:MAG: cytochrome c1, partial [Rhizobiales bacterium]|nr:cytochrome c1 [Hyphomicrobiales bacterium]